MIIHIRIINFIQKLYKSISALIANCVTQQTIQTLRGKNGTINNNYEIRCVNFLAKHLPVTVLNLITTHSYLFMIQCKV